MSWTVWVGLCSGAMSLGGCGGDESSNACGNSAGCGGDVVGTWAITSTCVKVDAVQMMGSMGCPGITSSDASVDMTGTVTYEAGGTFRSNVTLNVSVTVSVPASCLMQQGTTLTCAQLQDGLEGSSTTFASISCTGSSGCSCVAQLGRQQQASSGTYTTSGSTLTQSAAGNDPERNAYCVNGNTLTLSPDPSSGTAGTITLTKQ